ncbi:DUF7415 domain-containing protein [Phytobacter sp. V91]|uniref:DUF7415 domain-containing protein n=1 Tax=Phytobacter sp. V91 TaxID=3369425 RepID=UPI003F631E80
MTTPISKQRLQDLYEWLRNFRDRHKSTVGVYQLSKQNWHLFDDAMAVVLEKIEHMKGQPEYFISGVIDDGEECIRVGDEEAKFWTVYRQNIDGTSAALMDFHSRERAETMLTILNLDSSVEATSTATHWSDFKTEGFPSVPAGRTPIGGCDWLDWNQLSALGLIVRINKEILHPMGLALCRNPESGISEGALIAPDGKWEYASGHDKGGAQ